jgi:hypothetical protein
MQSRKGIKKRIVAKIEQDERGPYTVINGWEYRASKSDVITGLLVFKRPDLIKKETK